MKRIALLLFAVVIGGAAWETSTEAAPTPQSAKEVRGVSPYLEIKSELAPKLIVDQPLAEGLKIGVVWIQYRVENLRIVPVFGEGAAKVSPRVGHLHVTVDDQPWWWGRRERQQHDRHRGFTGRSAQGAD